MGTCCCWYLYSESHTVVEAHAVQAPAGDVHAVRESDVIDRRIVEQTAEKFKRCTHAIVRTVRHVVSNFDMDDNINGKHWVVAYEHANNVQSSMQYVDVSQITNIAANVGCTFSCVSDQKSGIPAWTRTKETKFVDQDTKTFANYLTLLYTNDCGGKIPNTSKGYVLCFDFAKKHITLYV